MDNDNPSNREWDHNQFIDEHGIVAYRYRRLYDEMVRQLGNIYEYADEHDIDLPDPGPPFT